VIEKNKDIEKEKEKNQVIIHDKNVEMKVEDN